MKEKKNRTSVKKESSNPNDKIKSAVIEKKIAEIVCGTIQSLGFVLWSIEFSKNGGDWILAIAIDNPAGSENETAYITMDDCMAVYKTVDPILDETDPIPGAYTLEISSPGLNRALKTDAHLNQYINKDINLSLYAKDTIINKKNIKGCLISFDASSVTVKPGNGENIIFERKAVAQISAADEINL